MPLEFGLRAGLAIAGTMALLAASAAPARADWDGYGHGWGDHDGWREHWHHHWHPPFYGYGARYYYAPPPVYYAPPYYGAPGY